jgi:hypothetical protein
MGTIQHSHNHYDSERNTAEPQAMDTPDPLHLFFRDLARCPQFDRAAEYELACRTRSTWLHLVSSLEAQHERIARLLGTQDLPTSYEAISEPDIVHLLHRVHIQVDRVKTHGPSLDLASLRTWLVQMRANLVPFRQCRDEMVRRHLRFAVMLARRYEHSRVSSSISCRKAPWD